MQEKTISDVCLGPARFVFGRSGIVLLAALISILLSFSARAQETASVLPPPAREQINSLASRVAEQIRQSKIDPAYPKVFVMDFANANDKQVSKLGSILADNLAQALSGLASGFQVEDRKSFAAYLKENWMGLDDLQNETVCLTLARSMGGAGILRGTLVSVEGQQLHITLETDGFGPAWVTDAQFPLTPELEALLKQPAASFARSPDSIATEAGILRPGVGGVSLPSCVFCPSPDYTDLARVAKYRGTVELSLIVTKDGSVNSVMVLKGAPFSLTQQAIDTVQKWKFNSAKLRGQSVSVRVPVDIEFQLY